MCAHEAFGIARALIVGLERRHGAFAAFEIEVFIAQAQQYARNLAGRGIHGFGIEILNLQLEFGRTPQAVAFKHVVVGMFCQKAEKRCAATGFC